MTEFSAGDRVRILEGLFAGFDAEVDEVDTTTRMIRISFRMHGRPVPIDLDLEEAGAFSKKQTIDVQHSFTPTKRSTCLNGREP